MTDLLMNQVTDFTPVIYDYLTDLPIAHCPRCDRPDTPDQAIVIHDIPGRQCLACHTTWTGPYIRSAQTAPPDDRRYSDRPDWTASVNAIGQTRIRSTVPS